MKIVIKIISNLLHILTFCAFAYLLIWILRSFIGAYTYHRSISVYFLVFSVITLIFQIIALFVAEKKDTTKKKIVRFLKVASPALLIYISLIYKESPNYVMSYWDSEKFNNASIVYCYNKQGVWFGEGDRYAILEVSPRAITNYITTLRFFDEKKDWSFGGYYLKFSPDKFKRYMVSEKLGSEYLFEIKKNDKVKVSDRVPKVRIHIWMPVM